MELSHRGSDWLQSHYNSASMLLNATSVTKTASIQAMLNYSFLTFLEHVHTAPQAIKSHMLLSHPHPEAGCKPENETDAEILLTGEDIVNRARLQIGAHAILLTCGSSVTDARVQDEVLGLFPAFFHAGARSVLTTLWDIERETAYEWLQAVQQAWESAERDLRVSEKAEKDTSWGKMLDLAEIFRTAAKIVMKSPEAVGINSWAPFVYSGY